MIDPRNTPDHDAPETIEWKGDYITAKTRGRWEYVGRARNIRAAVILPLIGDQLGVDLNLFLWLVQAPVEFLFERVMIMAGHG